MQQKRSKIAAIVLLFCMLSLWLLQITAFADGPQPSKDFYVSDYAGIFSAKESAELVSLGRDLYNTTGAQIAVLTIDSTIKTTVRKHGCPGRPYIRIPDEACPYQI